MTYCRQHDDLLDDVAVGAAPSAEFDAHLRTCAACAAELERRAALVARIDDAARAWMDVSPRVEVVVRVERTHPWRIAVVGAALAAALAVLFVTGYVLRKPTSTQTILSWQSPTADLLRPSVSVLDTHSL
jgi:hypothetical protein